MNEESRTVREIESRLDGLKQEVDALQVKVLSETAPWYRQASTLIAFFALVFSFGTTVISYQRAAEQDALPFIISHLENFDYLLFFS